MTTVGGQKVQTTPSEPNMQVKIEEVRKELHEASLPKEHEDYSARKEMETMPTESEPKWYSSSWKKWLFPVAACLLVALAFIFWSKGEADGVGGTALDTQAFAVTDSIPSPEPAELATPTSVEEEVPAPSLLYVTTSPTGATVYVDGKKVGTSPIEGKEVTRGLHTLRISKNGYESITVKKKFGDKPVVLNETLVADVKAVSPPVSSASTVPTTGTINGHAYVDLGLSVKWADRNVGAGSASDYGDYFAWGETSPKSSYDKENSVTWKKSFSDISGNSQYDAARANWGGSWRLPTEKESRELKNKCTWTWTSQGGHSGYKVTGPNGKSIFLPAAGCRDGASLSGAGEYCDYWSSTPYGSYTQGAYGLYFGSIYLVVHWSSRYYGQSVRPVSE